MFFQQAIPLPFLEFLEFVAAAIENIPHPSMEEFGFHEKLQLSSPPHLPSLNSRSYSHGEIAIKTLILHY